MLTSLWRLSTWVFWMPVCAPSSSGFIVSRAVTLSGLGPSTPWLRTHILEAYHPPSPPLLHCDTASLEKHSRWEHQSPALPVARLLLEEGERWDRTARWDGGRASTHLGRPLRCFNAGQYAAKPQPGAHELSDFTHKLQNRR